MQNPVSQHVASCEWEVPRGAHCWQGCHMRRAALTKKRGKTQKMRGSEGKLLENWKKEEKNEKGREKSVKKVENGENMGKGEGERKKEEEKERRKGWDAGLLHDTANVVWIIPAMSRPPLHKKRPCSNRFGKTQKMQIRAERTLVRHHKQTKMAPPQAQKATDAHYCPKKPAKMPQNTITTVFNSAKMPRTTAKNDKLMSTIRTNHANTWQKRKFDVQN